MAEASGDLNVTFIFVQATRSESFDGAHRTSFGLGVQDFFSAAPRLQRNATVTAAAELMGAVMDESIKFKHGNPSCLLYYVCTGQWQDAADLVARIEMIVSDLQATGLFSRITFFPIDAAKGQQLYRKTKSAITREFNFVSKITLPDVDGVESSYLGVLPAMEYVKLLSDDEDGADAIVSTLFYDNVRDWHGYNNSVNDEIRKTLNSAARDRFVLMNNGITIITRELRPLGNKFLIEDYSIVNGCQTSNVSFDQRGAMDQRVMVPNRLIHTKYAQIIMDIIHSTNFQTEIKPEQFFALEDYPKQLEDYFETFPEAHRLYFERRDRQYARLPITKARIVTLPNMIRAFASMFLNEPHRATRKYSGLKAKVGTDIFAKAHKCDPYYTAAYAMYRLENLFRTKLQAPRSARFHMLMAVRLLGNPVQLPRFNSAEMERYCAELNRKLWDVAEADRLFADAADVIGRATQQNFDRDNIRTEGVTTKVIELCREF